MCGIITEKVINLAQAADLLGIPIEEAERIAENLADGENE